MSGRASIRTAVTLSGAILKARAVIVLVYDTMSPIQENAIQTRKLFILPPSEEHFYS